MAYKSKFKGKEIDDRLDLVLKLLEEIKDKQDAIDNLDIIISNAEMGATALQSVPEEYITETELNGKCFATTEYVGQQIENIEIPEVPTNVSAFTNDAGYLTEHQSLKTINNQSIVGLGNIVIEGEETNYQSAIENKDIAMPDNVGGIDKGTKVKDLEGKSYNEMFDTLLFPTVYPTFIAPSASIAFNNYSSVQEVGNPGPSFITNYKKGEIRLNGVYQDDRGGELSVDYIYLNGQTSQQTIPSKVPEGNTTFTYRVYYGEGPQPKDSKGNNYGSPLSSGSVDSNTITLSGTYPWYASTAKATNSNEVVEQSLIAWNVGNMSTGQFTLQPSGTLPQVFKLPNKIQSLQMKNPISGNMENVEMIDGVPKGYTETEQALWKGNPHIWERKYYVYTYNGAARGEVTLLAIF